MTAGVAGDADTAGTGLGDGLDRGGGLMCHGIGECGRHLVGHLRHQRAEAGHQGGKDHDVTHYATLDPNTRRYHHVSGKVATNCGGNGFHFDQKDERRVNAKGGIRWTNTVVFISKARIPRPQGQLGLRRHSAPTFPAV